MQRVEIRVKEHLDIDWSEWLEGFTIVHTGMDETLLTGTIPDQTALYGLMAKLRDLGVTLIAVNFGEQVSEEGEESQDLTPAGH